MILAWRWRGTKAVHVASPLGLVDKRLAALWGINQPGIWALWLTRHDPASDEPYLQLRRYTQRCGARFLEVTNSAGELVCYQGLRVNEFGSFEPPARGTLKLSYRVKRLAPHPARTLS
jgi:hypothetical protein